MLTVTAILGLLALLVATDPDPSAVDPSSAKAGNHAQQIRLNPITPCTGFTERTR